MTGTTGETISKKFIFIAGHHRSGTSLIHRILRGHPLISGFENTGVPQDEGQHLQSVFKPAKAYGGPGKYLFNKSSHMNEHHELASEDSANRIFKDWSQHWKTQLPYLLEKSPPNLARTRFLQKLFPNSIFVGITRHPIAVSYATQKWSKSDISSLLDHTLLGYEILEEDSKSLKSFYLLRYEDFVLSPQRTIDSLLAHIGLPSHPLGQDVRTGVNHKYFHEWELARHGRDLMSERTLNFLETRCARFGYSILSPLEDQHIPMKPLFNSLNAINP